MQTLSQGFIYILIGIILSIIIILTEGIFNIPLFIGIPVVLLSFWAASNKTEETTGKGDMSGEKGGGEDE